MSAEKNLLGTILVHNKLANLFSPGVKVANLFSPGVKVANLFSPGVKVANLFSPGVKVANLFSQGVKMANLFSQGVKVANFFSPGVKVANGEGERSARLAGRKRREIKEKDGNAPQHWPEPSNYRYGTLAHLHAANDLVDPLPARLSDGPAPDLATIPADPMYYGTKPGHFETSNDSLSHERGSEQSERTSE